MTDYHALPRSLEIFNQHGSKEGLSLDKGKATVGPRDVLKHVVVPRTTAPFGRRRRTSLHGPDE
jgi:hypothetical protein